MSEDIPSELPALAQRLDHLFRTVRPAGLAREYTYKEVAAGVVAAGGPATSENYLYQMRTGRRDNPTLKLLEGLAEFFGTDTSYFTAKDAADIQDDEELRRAALLRDEDVMSVAMRSSGVPKRHLTYVLSILDQVRALEGLSDEAKPPLREWGVEPPETMGE